MGSSWKRVSLRLKSTWKTLGPTPWVRSFCRADGEIQASGGTCTVVTSTETDVDLAYLRVESHGEAVHLQVALRFGADRSGRARLDNSAVCSGMPADPTPRSASAISKAIVSAKARGTRFWHKRRSRSWFSQALGGRGELFYATRNKRSFSVRLEKKCRPERTNG